MCTSGPCQNGATCVVGHRNYSCKCQLGWEGKNCDKGDCHICISSILGTIAQKSSFACHKEAEKKLEDERIPVTVGSGIAEGSCIVIKAVQQSLITFLELTTCP